MTLPLKCYTSLVCIIIITSNRGALAKEITDGELDKAEPNQSSNGTLKGLSKHLRDRVKKGEIFVPL